MRQSHHRRVAKLYRNIFAPRHAGYKEFVSHLQSHPLPKDPEPGSLKSFFDPALTQMKHNTRKYAQRQVKWIRNKLLPAVLASNTQQEQSEEESSVPTTTKCCVYLLDATGMYLKRKLPATLHEFFIVEVDERWNTNVLKKAEEITKGDHFYSHPLARTDELLGQHFWIMRILSRIPPHCRRMPRRCSRFL